MNATETRLGALLERSGQYVVPHFQRAYSWRGRQWATLWADIQELYALESEQPHFMGSVVLLSEGAEESSGATLLIDGQQRLVTLSLFLAAVRDRAFESAPALAKRIQQSFLSDQITDDRGQPRIQCSYQDHEAFASIILRQQARPGSPVTEAYETFLLDLSDVEARGISLERLTEIVTSRLAFVSISLDTADNPYRVFESLNAKGMPLTQGDLLRNYFFMRLPAEEHDSWFRSVWQPMQTRLGDALDAFMHDYLVKDGEEVREEEVYQTWRRRLTPMNVEDVKTVLQDLSAWSVEYDRLLHLRHEPDSDVRRRLEWLSAWSQTLKQPLMPFLLLVQTDLSRGVLNADEASAILRSVQSYLARRVFTAASDTDDDQQLIQLYREPAGEMSRSNAFIETLSRPELGWPSDDELRQAMLNYRLYPRSHADQRQLILLALEDTFPRPTRAGVGDYDIELIAPLLPRDEWLRELGGNEELHWTVVGTIGNLTWVERGQSSRLPLPVDERLQFLHRQARRCPALAKDVQPLDGHWSAEAIRARSLNLADRAIQVWDGPRR
jgi:hypothetical protein